jgi:hypothetical protein
VTQAMLRSSTPGGVSTAVAVKVQRPNILENITLDLVTLRALVAFFASLRVSVPPPLRFLPSSNTSEPCCCLPCCCCTLSRIDSERHSPAG